MFGIGLLTLRQKRSTKGTMMPQYLSELARFSRHAEYAEVAEHAVHKLHIILQEKLFNVKKYVRTSASINLR